MAWDITIPDGHLFRLTHSATSAQAGLVANDAATQETAKYADP